MNRAILIVDDADDAARVLAAVRHKEGDRLISVDDAMALHEIARDPPDLVLSDVVMADLDGVDLARRLGKLGWTMPVVLMSGVYDHVDLPGVHFLPNHSMSTTCFALLRNC